MPRRSRWGLVALAGLALAGCQTGVPPDPNDPNQVGALQPEVLRRSLKYASDALMERRLRGEIDDRQYRELMARYAQELLDRAQIDRIDPKKAWEYAEVFRTARQWRQAAALLRVAVANAPTTDRRVNDSLRLAQALSQLGKVDEAIPLVRSTFGVSPQDKAPILTATLLEIVPAARGKGRDVELAKLLEEAIAQANATIVDPASGPGRAFLAARPYHVRNAWRTVVDLYRSGGRADLAAAASARARASLAGAVRT